MKKFVLIIFSALYTLVSIGFINNTVYCQNKLIKISPIVNNQHCDQHPNCGEKECKKGGACCKHSKEHIQLKVDQNYSSHQMNFTPHQIAILNIYLSGYLIPEVNTLRKETYPVTNAPPSEGLSSIHILNCTYLI